MPSPIISIAQMRTWEQAAWAAGRTEEEVIRRVGKCVARTALRLTNPEDLIVILAGKGHNGEDARCARQHLVLRRVDLLDVSDPAKSLGSLDALLSLKPALVIDGLFGIGVNRPLGPGWVQLIDRLNASGIPVLAVDVPSGLNADTGLAEGVAVRAAVTLTVGAPKTGLLRESAWPYVGRLELADEVGLPPCPIQTEVQWTLAQDFTAYPPQRRVDAHKGLFGHLVILAGSTGYHGAAVLAARGAQRAHPGLITLLTPESVYVPVASQLQAAMVSALRFNGAGVAGLEGPWNAILAGPGLAAADLPQTLKMSVRELWLHSPLPMVADASALDWLPAAGEPATGLRVITPHPGEAARMLGVTTGQVQRERIEALRKLSARYGDAWVVLKGHQTLVGRSSGEVFVNSSGNPHLAQGGSGDLLAGFIGGLLAQPALREDPCRLLRFAVWRHGAAADQLQDSGRRWVVEDLAASL